MRSKQVVNTFIKTVMLSYLCSACTHKLKSPNAELSRSIHTGQRGELLDARSHTHAHAIGSDLYTCESQATACTRLCVAKGTLLRQCIYMVVIPLQPLDPVTSGGIYIEQDPRYHYYHLVPKAKRRSIHYWPLVSGMRDRSSAATEN